jgi:hypothetical protein
MPPRWSRRLAALLGAALAAAGCATTRVGAMGPLPSRDALVTLVVSEDRAVVAGHCRDAFALGPILGCHSSRPAALPDGTTVRVVTIVRFTDALPSAMAFEIDLHELCHAVASLQGLADPCHDGNHGLLRASTSGR